MSRFFYSICCGSCSIRPRKCSEWYYVPQCYNYESASTWRLNRQLSRLYGSTRAALGEKVAEAQRHLQILIEDQRKLAEMSVSECYDPITYMVPCLACFRLDLPAYGQFYRAMDQWSYETSCRWREIANSYLQYPLDWVHTRGQNAQLIMHRIVQVLYGFSLTNGSTFI